MLDMKIKTEVHTKRVKKATEKMAFNNLSHAIASISRAAKKSIKRSKSTAAAGQPPHTRRGVIRRAIRYVAGKSYHPTKQGAMAGPLASVAGQSGSAHEFGGEYMGEQFPERSFMQPALREAIPRFAGNWRGSLGG